MALLLTMALAECTDDSDFTPPAFLHVDAVSIVAAADNDIVHGDANFYTSDIVATYVLLRYPEQTKLDTLGLFRLPFTVPVLHNGDVESIELYPAVEMSGQHLTLPFYTYYNPIVIKDTAVHSGDTLDLGALTTCYNPQTDFPMLFEPFEPTSASIFLDSTVQWVRHDHDNACTGDGYGRVDVSADTANVGFSIDHDFYQTDATKVMYMEIDIRTDVTVVVYMHAAYSDGGNENTNEVMRIKATDGQWRHIYVNLGKTWAYFNHPKKFRLSFAALNVDGNGGTVLMDNIKVLSTSVQ